MGRSREKVKGIDLPDEWKIAREYIYRYIHSGRISESKLASAIIHKGKRYEAFIVVKERDEK
jgi:hypothetical protein